MTKRWLAGLMTHQYKKLPVTMRIWMQLYGRAQDITRLLHHFEVDRTGAADAVKGQHGNLENNPLLDW